MSCESGTHETPTSPGPQSSAWPIAAAHAATAPWERTTPRGLVVGPDVYWISAGSRACRGYRSSGASSTEPHEVTTGWDHAVSSATRAVVTIAAGAA